MAEEYTWGPWVAHDGSGCPLPEGTYVEVIACYPGNGSIAEADTPVRREGILMPRTFVWDAMDWSNYGTRWSKANGCLVQQPKVTHYRIRALTQLIELVETLPAQPQEVGV